MLKTKATISKNIIFVDTIGVSTEYAPKPAIKFIPQWYKEIESIFPKEKRTPNSLPTIKKCMPVLDAITAGYIIVSPCDVYVSFENDEPNYKPALDNIISSHPRKQGYKHPKASDFEFPKWVNPWSVKTPKGYSSLFIPPMHNPNPWFEILEGIVDTDIYSAPVNFPFVLKTKEKDFIIPAGTPIAQVIPIKRDEWQLIYSENKKHSQANIIHLQSHFIDRYKRLFWNRKRYL